MHRVHVSPAMGKRRIETIERRDVERLASSERDVGLLSTASGVACGAHHVGGAAMTFEVGDRVVAEAESTERRPRAGTVREVVRQSPARYRIEWDDGHESIYTPASGALRPERGAAGTPS
jgi:hypothetical protein